MFVFQDGKSISAANPTDGARQRDRVLKIGYVDKKGRAKPIKDSDDFVFLEWFYACVFKMYIKLARLFIALVFIKLNMHTAVLAQVS